MIWILNWFGLITWLGLGAVGMIIGLRKGYPIQGFLLTLFLGLFIPWFLWWLIPLLFWQIDAESEKARKRREKKEWKKWENERAEYYKREEEMNYQSWSERRQKDDL